MTALTTIAMINKKPCVYGDGASALIQSRGHLERMTIEEIGAIPAIDAETRKFADDFGVRVTMWRPGYHSTLATTRRGLFHEPAW